MAVFTSKEDKTPVFLVNFLVSLFIQRQSEYLYNIIILSMTVTDRHFLLEKPKGKVSLDTDMYHQMIRDFLTIFRYAILQRFVSCRLSEPDTRSKSSPAFHYIPIIEF